MIRRHRDMIDLLWMLLGLMLWCAFATWLIGCGFGCQSRVQGGSQTAASDMLDITGGQAMRSSDLRLVLPDGTVLEMVRLSASTQPSIARSSESSASTQPSASSWRAMPRLDSNADGTWSISFDQLKVPPRSSWPLFGIFLAAGFVAWKFGGSLPIALACLGLGVLSIVWLPMLQWLALGAVVLGLWPVIGTIVQLIRGAQASKAILSEPDRARVVSAWEAVQDATTRRVVKKVKGG